MISPFVKVYYFTLPIFLLDPPTDGVIRKDSYGQGKLFPSEGAMKNKSGLHWGWDGEDKWTHTTVRASLGMGLCHEWRKVKGWQARVGLWVSCNRRELRKKLAWQELWMGKRKKLTPEGQLEQVPIREGWVWCRRGWGESLIFSLSAVVMTHLFHAAVCLFEQKLMLNLYDRSNLAGGALSSVLQHQWKKKLKEISKEKILHIYFAPVRKAISILSYGTACLGCII